MAKLKLAQGVDFDLPEVGEVFTSSAGTQGQLFLRTENQGIVTFDPGGAGASQTGARLQQAQDVLGGQSVRNLNLGDVLQGLNLTTGQNQRSVASTDDLSLFKPTGVQEGGEVFTQQISALNPQAADIVSNRTGIVQQAQVPTAQAQQAQAQGQQVAAPQSQQDFAGVQAPDAGFQGTEQLAQATQQPLASQQAGGQPLDPFSPEGATQIAEIAGQALSPQQPQQAIFGPSSYQGPSVVDYLSSVGQANDFGSRSELARNLGITNYTGTADQNTRMLELLRSGAQPQQIIPQASPGESLSPIQQQQVLGTTLTNLGGEQQSFTDAFVSNPDDTLKQFASAIFENSGLPELRAQIKSNAEETEALENDRDTQLAEINDNPWISEALRSRQVQKLNAEFDGRLNNLNNKQIRLNALSDDITEEARFNLTMAVGQFNAQREFDYNRIQDIMDRQDSLLQAERDESFRQDSLSLDRQQENRIASGGGGGAFTGASTSSFEQVLDGFTSLSELTPTNLAEVKGQLFASGFGSDTPPDWFREFIQQELRQNLIPSALKAEWLKYRDSVLSGQSSVGGSGTLDFDAL